MLNLSLRMEFYRAGKQQIIFKIAEIKFLIYRFIDDSASFTTKTWVERVIIVGLDKIPSTATLRASSNQASDLSIVDASKTAFTIRKPGVSMMEPTWSIKLNF